MARAESEADRQQHRGQRTAILGGGALGLTVALRLAQRGWPVTVFEKESEPGGLAAGFRPAPELPGGGPYLEKFYHHLFRSDTVVTALIHELGLGERLTWEQPANAVVYGGRLWQPYTPLGLLRFSPLSLVERARMAAALAYLKAEGNYHRLERYTAGAWLPRWMGRRSYEALWEPLLRAKFGAHYADIAMSWFWARIHYRSFALGYLHGGFQLLYDALVAEIRRLGGEVRLGQEVLEARHTPGQAAPWSLRYRATGVAAPGMNAWGAHTPGAEQTQPYARVVSTLPTRLTVRVAPQLPEEFRRRYDWGDAYGAHCLVLALDRQLLTGGEYWVNVNDPGFPFLVLVEHTNYVAASEYGGRHLIYLGNYLPMDHRLFQMEQAAILAEFLPALRRLQPDFRDEWVRQSWAFGAPYAQPIVTREYAQHIPPFKTPLAGLWLGSMFQVYPQDRGQNYSVALGNRLAQAILIDGARG